MIETRRAPHDDPAEMSAVDPTVIPRTTEQTEVISMSTTTTTTGAASPNAIHTDARAIDTDARSIHHAGASLSEAELRAMLLGQADRPRVSGFDRVVMRVSLVALLWARHHTDTIAVPHEEQLRLVLNDRAREARLHREYLTALQLR